MTKGKRERSRVSGSRAKLLAASALVSAGVAAYFSSIPSHQVARAPAVEVSDQPGAVDVDHVERAMHMRSAKSVAVASEQVPEEAFVHRPQLTAAERDVLEAPTIEEARNLQRPRAEVRDDIVRLGIDALLDEPKCSLPALLVKSARSGAGTLGCAIDQNDGRKIFVGRVVHRLENGNLAVGQYEDGTRTGTWDEYFPTGVLAASGEYLDGQKSGAWHEYDTEGVHRVIRNYLDGGKYGVTVKYFKAVPEIELWSSVGRLDPETKMPLDDGRLAVAR